MSTTEINPTVISASGFAVFANVGPYGGVTLELEANDGTQLRFVGKSTGIGLNGGRSTGRASFLVSKAALLGAADFAVTAVASSGEEGVVINFSRNGTLIGSFIGLGVGTAASFSGSGTWT